MLRTPHLDQQYEHELEQITAHLLKMGNRAEAMVHDAVRALLDRDLGLARKVIGSDDELDRLEVETDALCVALMARRSPVGGDLRLVTCALKIVTDLERVGDLAVNIARRAIELNTSSGIEVLPEVAELARVASDELGQAMTALRKRDSAAAVQLQRGDKQVDEANRLAFDRLIHIAKDHPDQFERALAITSVCRHLERVGDHAVNIGEMVVYLVSGQMVRHQAG